MRILIVGCGYVGLPLGEILARRGHEVHAVRRTAIALAGIENTGLRPHATDITRREQLDSLPGPFDWVINTVSSSRGNTAAHRAVFVDGTRHLLDWLNGSATRLVFTSSTSVYEQTNGAWVDEESLDEPEGDTGQNLALAEELFLESSQGATILRVAGIYGPGRGYLYRQFLKDEAVMDGERWLNMIHRDDVINAILCAMKNEPSIYNVTDDEPVTQRKFFAWLAELLNKPMPPSGTPASSSKRKRTNKRVANGRLKALGWTLRYPTFREGYSVLHAVESADTE